MANEYATLTELKALRRKTDTTDDTALQSALTRASRAIDQKTGRRFYLDSSASARMYNPHGRVVCAGGGYVLLVDDVGSTTGLVVETGTAAAGWTAVSDYETHPDNALNLGDPVTGFLLASGTWPSGSTRVRVTAKWGWPAVPDEIAQACLLLANRLYLRKDSPEGIAGSAEWGVIRLSRWDPDVEVLVGPYVIPGFG